MLIFELLKFLLSFRSVETMIQRGVEKYKETDIETEKGNLLQKKAWKKMMKSKEWEGWVSDIFSEIHFCCTGDRFGNNGEGRQRKRLLFLSLLRCHISLSHTLVNHNSFSLVWYTSSIFLQNWSPKSKRRRSLPSTSLTKRRRKRRRRRRSWWRWGYRPWRSSERARKVREFIVFSRKFSRFFTF